MRIVFEPKSRTVEQQSAHHRSLLAHTSLESERAAEPDDGRPRRPPGAEGPAPGAASSGSTSAWPPSSAARATACRRCWTASTCYEGRQLVLLNIDEVIKHHPQQPTSPRPALIARFKLSDRQAEDILELRLRQLGASLEAIKHRAGPEGTTRAAGQARRDPGQRPAALKRTVIKEIEADAKATWRRAPHADPGREEGRRRDQGGGRAGDGGREHSRAGCARSRATRSTWPRSPSSPATALYGVFPSRTRGHAAGLRQQWARVYSVGRERCCPAGAATACRSRR